MKIIFSGIIGRYPWGGVTWCSLMYLLGLRRLGHEVYYLEDTGECNYDPIARTMATDPSYALDYIHASLASFDLGERWCYVDYTGRHHGPAGGRIKALCESADMFIVLSGGCWNWREHYLRIPQKVFIDSDPGFTQLALHKASEDAAEKERSRWYVEFFKTYDHLFTFGRNIGSKACPIPIGDLHWNHTWQPVCLESWPAAENPPNGARRPWTTIMTWEIESFKDVGGNKDSEFLQILDLANRCKAAGGPEFELAINGPMDFLRKRGWPCRDAFSVSETIWLYRDYIQSSRAEFSVAKKTYVRNNTGWFSDRTACYLASGRPAVVQETGFSAAIPSGDGVIAWRTGDEAYEAIQRIEKDYDRHAKAARAIAREHFDATILTGQLLRQCG